MFRLAKVAKSCKECKYHIYPDDKEDIYHHICALSRETISYNLIWGNSPVFSCSSKKLPKDEIQLLNCLYNEEEFDVVKIPYPLECYHCDDLKMKTILCENPYNVFYCMKYKIDLCRVSDNPKDPNPQRVKLCLEENPIEFMEDEFNEETN